MAIDQNNSILQHVRTIFRDGVAAELTDRFGDVSGAMPRVLHPARDFFGFSTSPRSRPYPIFISYRYAAEGTLLFQATDTVPMSRGIRQGSWGDSSIPFVEAALPRARRQGVLPKGE